MCNNINFELGNMGPCNNMQRKNPMIFNFFNSFFTQGFGCNNNMGFGNDMSGNIFGYGGGDINNYNFFEGGGNGFEMGCGNPYGNPYGNSYGYGAPRSE